MTTIDVNQFRELDQQLQEAVNIDENYTFYYDETNNIRKFHVREDGFNQSFKANFVLGGVMHQGTNTNLQELFQVLNTNNLPELKFKHIAHGDFITCLTSKKLKVFTDFLISSDLYVHFSSVNILYFSIVDIVDSALVDNDVLNNSGPDLIFYLKNTLYKLSKLEHEAVVDLFWSYGYPNIKADELEEFIDDLIELFQPYLEDAHFHIGLTILSQALEEAKSKALPFIMDEQDHVLIKHFGMFYLRPIYLFKNSEHIFDRETSIEPILDDCELIDNGQIIKPYRFEDSKNDLFLQVSDIFIGLMGKLYIFLNSVSIEEIDNTLDNLNQLQIDNLVQLFKLLDKTTEFNQTLMHRVDALEEINKIHYLFTSVTERFIASGN